jgi:1-phosphatidylinositol-3-phosphate 5-kinase
LDPNALNGKKALPRLPSIDDAYEILGERSTPKALIAGLPDTSEPDDCSTPLATPREPALDKRLPTDKTLPRDKALPANAPRLLLKLRYTFQQQEQDLYAELARTPATALNDVRRSFRSSAKGAARRLHAWQDKHITSPLGEKVAIRKLQAPDPAWWAPQCHAVPGGSVLVHEEDWGSIIAFMLSSMDYTRELAAIGIARPPPPAAPSAAPSVATSPLPSPAPISTLSYFTAPFRTSGSTLDPDADAVGWHEPEACSSVISRKQHPRDHLLSLRDVLLHKRSTDEPIEGSVLGRGAPPNASFPLSVFAKPAVEVSLQAADGEVADPVGNTTADRLLHELEGADTESSTSGILNNSISSASGFVETHIRRGKLASLVSSEDSRSDSAHESGSTTSEHTVAPAPQSEFVVVPAEPSDTSPATPSNNEAERSAVNTITSTLANAMRAVIGAGSTPHVSSRPAHHGLLATDPMVIDERPHLKYDFTVGKIRFSCTAYYAKQFDVLRRKCGIDDLFVKSMQKSTNWSAEGGRRCGYTSASCPRRC